MKRKASEEADTPDSKHRSKKARTESFNEIKVQTSQSGHELTYLIRMPLQEDVVEKPPLKIVPYPEKVRSINRACVHSSEPNTFLLPARRDRRTKW